MARRATYKGDGNEYLAGIPAQDLDEETYQGLDTEQRKAVRESSLYDCKTDKEMSAASAASPPAETPAPAASTKTEASRATATGEGK